MFKDSSRPGVLSMLQVSLNQHEGNTTPPHGILTLILFSLSPPSYSGLPHQYLCPCGKSQQVNIVTSLVSPEHCISDVQILIKLK